MFPRALRGLTSKVIKGPISLFISDNIIHATRLSGFPSSLTNTWVPWIPSIPCVISVPKSKVTARVNDILAVDSSLLTVPPTWYFSILLPHAEILYLLSFSFLQRGTIVPIVDCHFERFEFVTNLFIQNVPGIVRWSRVSGKRPCFHLSTVLYLYYS